MVTDDVVIIGKKGEILPKKKLRKVAGILPGDRVLIEARTGELVIKKIFSVNEALALPIIASGAPDEMEKELEEEGQRQEEQE